MLRAHPLARLAPRLLGISLCPEGKASRRQWWLGHLAAALLTGFGFLGAVTILLPTAAQCGLGQGSASASLVFIAATTCLAFFLAISDGLSRQRLDERGEAHDVADLVAGLCLLALGMALYAGARLVIADAWSLPALPRWLVEGIALVTAIGLAALALECGVFERASLTELWRGRPRNRRLAARLKA